MTFDKATRNALARMVGQTRERLKSDVMDQLRRFGFQADGIVLDLGAIKGLSETEREAATALRAQLDHFISLESGPDAARRQAAYDRLAREIGFTTLNRLVALRMAEERGLIVESVGKGLTSVGFQIYERVARDALGARAETYRAYLELLYDELALDLPALFDRMTPESRIFPGERCLEETLALLNDPTLAHLWREDEAIGWVYQYYNDPAERKKMRDASQAPRNSRELAIRNQFFTPRYVVEFLTDNTLGRIWYEMRSGETRLADDCRYLVRRKHPIWLPAGQSDLAPFTTSREQRLPQDGGELWTRPNPAFETWDEIQRYALTVDGYTYAQQHSLGDVGDLANSRLKEYGETGAWRGGFDELRVCLFFEQRRWRHFGEEPEGDDLKAIQALHKALCEAWDREADIIVYRPKKDPRDLKILDPACGSGHFLLYSFDLLATIYAEDWEDERGPVSEATGARLRTDYPDLDTLRRAIPGLILRHNLHGVDIDPRACQIAGLALWLRAQRAYQQLGLHAAERPPITKSNIVCAEPMPGELDMLDDYLRRHVDPRLHPLVRTIWDKMQLAGEAGTLLKIEEEIEAALRSARDQAMVDVPPVQVTLFAKDAPIVQQRMTFSTAEERAFWADAEEKLLTALRDYAAQATNGHATQRRLFADDAAQGFAFIDLCRQQFDVVLMNPPFGLSLGSLNDYLTHHYPMAFIDLLAAFVERAHDLCHQGMIGALTSRAGLFTTTLQEWRKRFLAGRIRALADLGLGILDSAMVEACAYVLPSLDVPAVLGTFVNVDSGDDKPSQIYDAVVSLLRGDCNRPDMFIRQPQVFSEIPGNRILYSLSPDFWHRVRSLSTMEPTGAAIKAGLTTYDDDRFLRLRWETGLRINPADETWIPIAKGGPFGTYYTDVHLVVNWTRAGVEVGEHNKRKYGTDAQSRRGSIYYLQPALTYSRRTHSFSARVLPMSAYFSDKGPAILPAASVSLAYLAGLFDSDLFRGLIHTQSQFGCFETGILKALPWVEPDPTNESQIGDSALRVWQEKRAACSYLEADPHFCCPFLETTASLAEGRIVAGMAVTRVNDSVRGLADSISRSIESLYSLNIPNYPEVDVLPTDHEIRELDYILNDHTAIVKDCMSYVLGCALGHWDVRIGQNRSLAPNLPTAFPGLLPDYPPASLCDPDGLPATPGHIVSEEWLRARPDAINLPPAGSVQRPTIADDQYPIRIAWDGILVDDSEHPTDIVRRVREALGVLWPGEGGTPAEAIEREACEILGVRELRDYFHKPSGFFEDHLKRYSKSRRQAPIYWPLSTASGSYTLWVYYHRLTSDTLYTAVNRHVEPKLAEVQRRLADDERALADGASGREASRLRASVEQGQTFQRELQDFRDELLRVAALPYQPNLNDGVIITAAPLHRLFRLPRWARDTKACWQKLERGDYDWAHLAYTLWPDRVRQKCRADKSLAIAHGLEALYIEPPATAKKARGRKSAAAEEVELSEVDEGEGEDE